MIRKLLLFALLLAGGFAALHFAVGWENVAGKSTVGKGALGQQDGGATDQSTGGATGAAVGDGVGNGEGASGDVEQDDPQNPPNREFGAGMSIPTKDGGTITTEFHGRMEMWLGERWAEYGTRTIRLPRATLFAEDSGPLPDGRQRMSDVRVEFFAQDKDPSGRPVNRIVATLLADTAFAELMADPLSGERSVRSDKEMELRGVRIETSARGSMQRATLEGPDGSSLARVFALVLEERVEIDTERAEPFVLTIAGDRPMLMTGEGLVARMPLGDSPRGRTDLIARSNPVLTYGEGADAVRLTGTGELRFAEVVGSGSALVSLADDVTVTIPGDSILPGRRKATDTTNTAPTTLRGDRLVARLARGPGSLSGGGKYGTAMLRSLRLRGALASIDAPGLHLECTEIVAIPALDGRPYAVSALGADTTMTVEEERDGKVARTQFRAGRHIHVVRPTRYFAPVLRAYGIPTWTAGSLVQRDLVVFDGASEITSYPTIEALEDPPGGPRKDRQAGNKSRPTGTLSLASAGGMTLWRGRSEHDPMVLRGKEATHLRQWKAGSDPQSADPELSARGGDGFTLTRQLTEAGDALHLQLGPLDDPNHAFELRHGDLVLDGTGSCAVERPAGGAPTVITLRSPDETLRARRDVAADIDLWRPSPYRPETLEQLAFLRASLQDQRLADLEVSGVSSSATWSGPEGQAHAHFRTLSDLGATGVLLTGTETDPATLDWAGPANLVLGGTSTAEATIALRGAQLEIYHLGLTRQGSKQGNPGNGQGAGQRSRDLPGGYLLLDARSPTEGLTRLEMQLPATDDRPQEALLLESLHIQLKPYVVAPQLSRYSSAGLPAYVHRLTLGAVGQPWLVADDGVHLTRTVGDPESPVEFAQARGDRLLLGMHNRTGRLTGWPASAQWTAPDQTTNDATAPTIRFIQQHDGPAAVLEGPAGALDAMGELGAKSATELRPVLTMTQPQPGRPAYRATVDGTVHMTPSEAWCSGPATLTPVDPVTGVIDESGVTVFANDLRVSRNSTTGEPMLVTARDGRVAAGSITGAASEVEVDLLRHTIRVHEPGGRARVSMDGMVFEAPTVRANYETMTLESKQGSFVLGGDTSASTTSAGPGLVKPPLPKTVPKPLPKKVPGTPGTVGKGRRP